MKTTEAFKRTIEELLERYGERTIDRLRALTTVVVFKGESLRK